MDEKKKEDEETNSSSLIPEQSGSTVSELMIRSQLRGEELLADRWSKFMESWRLYPAPSAASEEIHAVIPQPVWPLSRVSPSVSVNSYSSMNQPPSFHPQETQSSMYRNAWVPMAASNEMRHHWVQPVRPLRAYAAPSAASEKIPRLMYQPLTPPSKPLAPSVPVKSESSMSEPPDSHLQKTQSEPLRETDSTVSHVSMKSDSSMYEPLYFNQKRTQSEPLRETDSTVSHVSMKSDSSMYEPLYFNHKRTQSEPLRETDSTVSHVSMKSDSSMYQPLNFNQKRTQSQLTEDSSSCSVCEEDVKDPVRLLCGHWSCKQCVCSFWDRYGSTADDPCKKCARRSERDQDLQSVLLEKKIKRVEMETEKLQAEKEKSQVEKEKLQTEREKSQAEKEKLQAEKEKFELEKMKLALEIQLLEQQGKHTNYDHGVLIPNKGIPYIPYI
ncbi:uncharacterized protein [Pagrus major]|uniref:uncharacterized protein n=1 Tax=Pagrus major TaxID=143350 RepID=UPI003CC8D220